MEGLELAQSGSSFSRRAGTDYVRMDQAPSSRIQGHSNEGRPAETSTVVSGEQQQQRQSPPKTSYQPPPTFNTPVVETVRNDDDDDNHGDNRIHHQQPPPPDDELPTKAATYVIACMPQTQEQAIQLGMSLLFTLFVAGALLSLMAVKKYRFVVACVWFLLLSLFLLFCHFVQSGAFDTTTSRRRGAARLFHPVLQAAADMVSNELSAFREDWSEQVLLLTYEGGETEEEGHDNSTTTSPAEPEEHQPGKKRGWRRSKRADNNSQPKSRMFRLLVRPILPLIRRKRQGEPHAPKSDDAELV